MTRLTHPVHSMAPDVGRWPAVGDMEVVVRQVGDPDATGRRSFCEVFRPGVNEWVLVVGDVDGSFDDLAALLDALSSSIHAAAPERVSPSTLVHDVHRLLGNIDEQHRSAHVGVGLDVVRIELDSSGASATLAGVGHARPMVLRHAGWVDIRSHSAAPGSDVPSDDRVGLGPGDSLVITTEVVGGSRDVDGSFLADKVLPDVLVDQRGQLPATIAESLVDATSQYGAAALDGNGVVTVLRVPESVRRDGLKWVMRSTDASLENVGLPAYSRRAAQGVGDPVRCPCEALIRLPPEPPSIPALRQLLRRLFRSWRMDALAEGDLELLATEVATNAFSQTASPVTVIIKCTGPVVRVEVGDGERHTSRKRRLTFEDLHGHRLALVESLAARWGVSTTSTGSRMWFEVATADR